MSRISKPAMFTATMTLGAVVISVLCSVFFADASTPGVTKISSEWMLDLKTICAVGGVVYLGAWRLSRWMKAIEDSNQAALDRTARIEAFIAKLPCATPVCPPGDPPPQAHSHKQKD